MSDSGKRRPRLVADKRYGGSKGPKRPARSGGGSGSGGGKGRGKVARKAPPRKTARKAAPRRRSPAKRRNPVVNFFLSIFGWIFGLIWRVLWRLCAVTAALVILAAAISGLTMPPLEDLYDGRVRGSVTLLDDSGEVYAWRGDQFGGMVSAETVSPHLKNAIVATEDKRFYRHLGVSPRGIASAIRINLREGRGPLSGNGGSTITQQTAKLLCFGQSYDPTVWDSEAAYEADCRASTLARKAREAIYAVGMEMRYTKDDILTLYMNRAYLGEGTRGFEAASQRYFGKSAANVTPAEAAMLAGLLKAPTRYAPTNNLQRSRDRASVIVRLMEDQGYLSHAAAEDAIANPAQLSQKAQEQSGGYFADWIMSSAPDFLTSKTTADVMLTTTLDQRIQSAAEEAVKWVFEEKVREGSNAQAAVVVMSADGAVRAMVGGRDVTGGGVFNRATQALRQTGSSFKPFVYATALELGYHYNDVVDDAPLTIDIPGSGPWSPENYDHQFRGPVTLEEALMKSLNIPAVRVATEVGLENVRKIASDFGIQSDLAAGPALALGASESTLVEMVGAYAGILNGGSSVTPYGLKEVRLQGDAEPLMGSDGGIGERVIREEAARELIYMMRQVVTQGTGGRAGLADREIAGKTGTTQAARDAWFVGFSADYVAGVWMGYDDNTPLTGVTGSGLPAEIFHEVMTRVHDGLPVHELPMLHPAPEPARNLPGAPSQGSGQRLDNVIERALKDIFGLN
ncbi:penicillin-binding protein, 1A family [Pseudooceanicola antarcticus]|uniref:peptidoglycan glycosyltransferase n=1 Tax=Pseudooceanicola antarcticus TaxID=1247613 RepID=A0A285HLA1_9RHOB|nr:PBP1A family penicillin-binding protein [Pseudooceanicola antarcticus]SNY35546.1 penicillin-binding protein, 1A family [Pseudooceanicola antarcticus]